MAKTNSLQGKIREFQNLKKIRELSGNFTKVKKRNVSTGYVVASLHEIYQIVLFLQTDCKQYAFYCSLNNDRSSNKYVKTQEYYNILLSILKQNR